jgi:FlaG/FlaF family flagellin (archaellin)
MRRRSFKKQTISLVAALVLVFAAVVVTGLFGGSSQAKGAASEAALDAVASDAADAYAEGVVEIDLFDPAASSGSDVSVENGIVKISAAGVYSLSGTLNGGQIEVDTKGKVYLELNGIDVTSASGPALWIKNAKKVTLVLAAGATNSLADTATGDADAATLFSND